MGFLGIPFSRYLPSSTQTHFEYTTLYLSLLTIHTFSYPDSQFLKHTAFRRRGPYIIKLKPKYFPNPVFGGAENGGEGGFPEGHNS